MATMRISELAQRCGVPVTTLRFYDTVGLLPAHRTPAGYRVYGADAAERLAFIGAAKRLGLPLADIANLVTVWESGGCSDVQADLRPRIAARLRDAGRAAEELAAWTAFLRAALARLDALPDRPGRCGPGCGYPLAGVPGPAGRAPAPPSSGRPAGRWRSAPVSCSLPAAEAGDRVARWWAVTAGAQPEQITGGIRITLPADRAAEVAALAVAEQQCCPFLGFALHLDGPVLRLEVHFPAVAAGLLAGLFGPAA